MRFIRFQLIITAAFFACAVHAVDFCSPRFFTNATAIANGRAAWLAVLSADDQSKTNIQKLIGSQVAFSGGVAYGSTKLFVSSNIVVEVEIQPSRDVWRNVSAAIRFDVEALGILKSIDFEKRVIRIQANPKDWKIKGAD